MIPEEVMTLGHLRLFPSSQKVSMASPQAALTATSKASSFDAHMLILFCSKPDLPFALPNVARESSACSAVRWNLI